MHDLESIQLNNLIAGADGSFPTWYSAKQEAQRLSKLNGYAWVTISASDGVSSYHVTSGKRASEAPKLHHHSFSDGFFV